MPTYAPTKKCEQVEPTLNPISCPTRVEQMQGYATREIVKAQLAMTIIQGMDAHTYINGAKLL